MMLSQPPEYLPVRMLNEMAFCPRLFYLEWVQSEWSDNEHTVWGTHTHRRVDQIKQQQITKEEEPDPPLKISRSISVGDNTLRLIAKIDLLEENETGIIPIDYKKGHAPEVQDGAYLPERVQVAAQVMLLRKQGYKVPHGMLYFAGSRRRVKVAVTDALEAKTLELRDEAFMLAQAPKAPPPLIDDPRCSGCSLAGICLPDEHALLLGHEDRMRRVQPPTMDKLPLHVTVPGAVVRKSGEELIVDTPDGEKQRVPLRTVSNLQLYGSVKVTTPVKSALLREGAKISYLSSGGWLYGRTHGPSHKNVMLRIAQYQGAFDEGYALTLAKRFVRTKIWNSRVLLRRYTTSHDQEVMDELDNLRKKTTQVSGLDTLFGIEGRAATRYFRALAEIMQEKSEMGFDFTARNRRPPRDPINTMLSYGYALLTSSWTEVLERVGFDPYLGFLHQPRYGRCALALDMMEEFRSVIVDSVVVDQVRRKAMTQDDFIATGTACTMTQAGKKKFIKAYERRLQTEVKHSVFGYSIQYRQVFEVQARLLGRYLMGEIEEYPEFTTR